MKSRVHKFFGVLLAVTVLSMPAVSAPVEWTLNEVEFDDGSTMSGSFVFDATGYLSISTTLTCGSICIGSSLASIAEGGDENFLNVFFRDDLGSQWAAALFFVAPLSDAGGVVVLSKATSSLLTLPSGTPVAYVVSGSLVGVGVVPIPAAVWLFGSALGLLGWLRRKAA